MIMYSVGDLGLWPHHRFPLSPEMNLAWNTASEKAAVRVLRTIEAGILLLKALATVDARFLGQL